METREDGDDLIITFKGRGNEIDRNVFAAKLIGKKNNGDWFFGYSRLPGVKYKEGYLSARAPKLVEEGDKKFVEVEIQNFGEAESRKTYVYVLQVKFHMRNKIAQGTAPELGPMEKTILKIPLSPEIELGEDPEIVVAIR